MGESAIEPSADRPVRYPGLSGLSWLSRSETAWLIDRLPARGLFLEVGTASGVTAARIADARPGLSIVCVDPFPDHDAPHVTGEEPCRVDMWRRNRRPNMSLWLGQYACLIEHMRHGGGADAILIDAGHEVQDAFVDLSISRMVLRPEGVIFAHDYHEDKLPGVRAAADEFCSRFGFVPDGDHCTLRALRRP